MTEADRADRRRWLPRPWRARGLRLLVYALPIAGSLGFVRVATSITGVPTSSLWIFLLWWCAMSLTATAVVAVGFTFFRRLLPLGALLELSLVFPDEAPSRFRLALRSGTVDSLEERLRLMKEANEATTAQQSAEILLQLAGTLDVHDKITRGHSERVRAYSYSLGKELGLTGDDLDRLNWAALLHDIGKLEVSTEILNKPGRPTEEEWEELRQHPLHGEALVAPLREWLGSWTDAVGYHHERWDGDGYPRGIAGDEIPFAGRIVAIADVFDVITSTRSYKEAGGITEARKEITRCSGTQFDPRLVRAFVNISLGKMRLVTGPLSWLSHAPLLARLPITPSIGASLGGAAALATAAATGLASPREIAQAAPLREAPASPAVVSQGGHRLPAADAGARSPKLKPVPATISARPAPLRTKPAAEPAAAAPAPTAEPETQAPPSSPPETPAPTPSPSPAARPFPATPLVPTAPAIPVAPVTPITPVVPVPVLPAPVLPAPVLPLLPPPINRAPSFVAGPNQSVLEDVSAQTITGWATAISPGHADESSQNVSFSVSVDDPTLFLVQPSVAPNGKLIYKPAHDAYGVATVTVTAHDDGGTSGGGSDTSSSASFTITIAPVNDAPDFAGGANQSALEDAGAQFRPGWATGISAGPAGESSQTVSFSVSVDDPTLFAVQPVVENNGKLTFTPAANANGVATVTVTAHDNGGTANGGDDSSSQDTFTLTIAPVNDEPSFVAGADQGLLEDAGAQAVVGWATGISTGPANESSQSVSFWITSVDDPTLFAVQPVVEPNGKLTFTPAANANGVATVSVHVDDDGGTANGGDDFSSDQTFTITITPVNDAPSFAVGSNQVAVLAAQITDPGWATGISAGPADEASQNVSFSVTNDNPGIFAVDPAIAPNGTLSFRAALLALGSATVTVRIVDNGGTANGGSDTSGPQTFTITVIL